MIDLFTQGSAVVESLKKAVKFADDLKNVELHQSLLDLREYLSDLRDENLNLRNENRELRDKLTAREELVFDKNVWWRVDGDERIGPFCPKCYGRDEKVVRMGDGFVLSVKAYICSVCGDTQYQ